MPIVSERNIERTAGRSGHLVRTLLLCAFGLCILSPSLTWPTHAQRQQEAAVMTPHEAHVAAVKKAQAAAYAITDATNGCPRPGTDIFGWPAALLRECIYTEGPQAHRLTGYVILVDVKPETIATWIETACARELPNAGKCFQTILACGRANSGMMFAVTGNVMENMNNSPWENYFFRNGMTVGVGAPNGSDKQIPLERQKQLAMLPDEQIGSIRSGMTRFWRTTPLQFAARYPGEGVPQSLKTPQDRLRWLELARSEFLAALAKPDNRLLEAWVAAHPKPLSAGKCPMED